jgi:hypothetical protein
MTNVMTFAMSVLADGPNQTGPDFGKASPVGLLILVLLLIGTFVLVWSMNRHLKKLPESFDPQSDEGSPAAESAAAVESAPDESRG